MFSSLSKGATAAQLKGVVRKLRAITQAARSTGASAEDVGKAIEAYAQELAEEADGLEDGW